MDSTVGCDEVCLTLYFVVYAQNEDICDSRA